MLTPVVEVRTPVLQGTIEWRVLVVYRLDPAAVLDLIPSPFEAQLVNGFALGAIALSKLTDVRPQGLPALLGVSGEHATHLFAVKWADQRRPAVGVFIPKRHTSSRLTALIGDRLFPGASRRADFALEEQPSKLRVAFASRHGACVVDAAVHTRSGTADEVSGSELFAFTVEASLLFRRGAVGYSLRRKGGVLDGVEMRTRTWNMEHAAIDHARSSYFDDLTVFPVGECNGRLRVRDAQPPRGLARRTATDRHQRRLAALSVARGATYGPGKTERSESSSAGSPSNDGVCSGSRRPYTRRTNASAGSVRSGAPPSPGASATASGPVVSEKSRAGSVVRTCTTPPVGPGLAREARDELQVVDDERGARGGEGCVRVTGDLDIPRVERVLVESQPDELREVELHRAHAEPKARPLVGSRGRHPIDEASIGDERVFRLRACRFAFHAPTPRD